MSADSLDNRIRVFCSRVRLFDFLRPHDKLNLKRIDPSTALRAIIAAGLPLTKAEFEGLAQERGYIDEHNLFDYGRFCEDFYDTKPAGFYEKNPDALAAESGNGRASAFSVSPLDGGSAGYFVPLSEVEKALLDDTLEKVRHAVKTRGIVIKQFLKDFDEHHKGLVTANRFKRELTNSLPFLKPGEVELLAKAYMTADKADVRYMVFHNDATPAVEVGVTLDSPAHEESSNRFGSSTGGAGAIPLGLTGAAAAAAAAGPGMGGIANATRRKPAPEKVMEYKALPADDVEAIERSVIRQVWERRLKLWDCFCDWDKKRLGELVRPLFHRGLRQANLDGLSPACIDTLADKYALPSDPTRNTINWIEFVEEVERAFVEHGLEKDPSKLNKSFAHAVVSAPHPRLVRPTLSPAATEAVQQALDEIKHQIKRWRIFGLKAPLKDYDRCGEGMVTETQFLRVLAMFNLVPPSAAQRAALLDYYRGKGAKSHMIDYRAFLGEVMEEEAAQAAAGVESLGGH